MNEKHIAAILKNTYTTDQAHRRLTALQRYLEAVYFAGEKEGEKSLEALLAPRGVSPATIAALQEWGAAFYEQFSAETAYSQLSSLREEVERVPVVTLYVPVLFSEKEVARIGAWFRKNVHDRALMRMKIDPSAAGGCGIVWNSIYHDYSFKYFVRKRRAELLTIFDSYDAAS